MPDARGQCQAVWAEIYYLGHIMNHPETYVWLKDDREVKMQTITGNNYISARYPQLRYARQVKKKRIFQTTPNR